VWDLQTGQEVLSLQADPYGVYGVAFSPNGQSLAAACHSGVVKVWEATLRE
jgi:WD40 repeat protein